MESQSPSLGAIKEQWILRCNLGMDINIDLTESTISWDNLKKLFSVPLNSQELRYVQMVYMYLVHANCSARTSSFSPFKFTNYVASDSEPSTCLLIANSFSIVLEIFIIISQEKKIWDLDSYWDRQNKQLSDGSRGFQRLRGSMVESLLSHASRELNDTRGCGRQTKLI